MSKLEIVVESLNSKQEEVVVVEKTVKPLIFGRGYGDGITELVRFTLAPRDELYTAEELNEFMSNLVPDLEPDDVSPFVENWFYLIYGRMHFDEEVENGKRRIIIYPYPNERFARDILNGEFRDYLKINLRKLRRYKPGLIERLFNNVF